ncbi:MAG: C_GCAxxG_C_C family protein [Clostridia bacterium]|nr:C_GCAxxG_C_C family protein [Clostridia bacterium]
MNKKEIAIALFEEGFNCAQAVSAAFCEETGVSKEAMVKMASGFGGGIGRLREVCGAVSGMVLVANMLYGYESPTDTDTKMEWYKEIQSIVLEFKARNGSYVCHELLNLPENDDKSPVPEKRTAEYYRKRPCKEIVGEAAEILEKFIAEHK